MSVSCSSRLPEDPSFVCFYPEIVSQILLYTPASLLVLILGGLVKLMLAWGARSQLESGGSMTPFLMIVVVHDAIFSIVRMYARGNE